VFADMRALFKVYLKEFVELMLGRINLVAKEIGGRRVMAGELVVFLQAYMEYLNSNKVPALANIFEVF